MKIIVSITEAEASKQALLSPHKTSSTVSAGEIKYLEKTPSFCNNIPGNSNNKIKGVPVRALFTSTERRSYNYLSTIDEFYVLLMAESEPLTVFTFYTGRIPQQQHSRLMSK